MRSNTTQILLGTACLAVLFSCQGDPRPALGCGPNTMDRCIFSEGYANPYEGTLELLTWEERTRKASLELTGYLPSDDQLRAARDFGQDGFEAAVWEMMRQESFYERLKQGYNDLFLTDKYLGRDNALSLLDEDDFPNLRWYEAQRNGDNLQERVNDGLAREALELVAHVVRKDAPFGEILTADYTMANGYSAPSLIGLPDDGFVVNDDPDRFRPLRLPGIRQAGVLTSQMWLNRFPSSDTNVNRHRARYVLQFFLDFDINTLGDRPVDVDEVTGDNPTLNNPDCSVCHATLDPVAGLFKNWGDAGEFEPRDEWNAFMRAPGFGGEDLPDFENRRPLQWLAQRLADHPRFGLATVNTVYRMFTGRDPLTNPQDILDAGGILPYPDASQRAFDSQTGMIANAVRRFEDSNASFKRAVVEVMLMPMYGAKNAVPLTPDMAVELEPFGTERWLTPEHLDRKIATVAGVPWRSRPGRAPYLLDDYLLFYGGMDSDLVTTRVTSPNGVMAALSERMAHEVACKAVPADLTRNGRLLLPYVDIGETPGDVMTDSIRDNIRHLHYRILGEDLGPNDPEVALTFELLRDIYTIGATGVADGSIDTDLPNDCRFTRDYYTNQQVDDELRVTADDNYMIRTWAGVVAYLLTDYRFLHDY